MSGSSDAVEAAIRARRSVRGLEGPPLSSDEVEGLIALAVLAPAPHHTQPWRFVEVSAERRAPLAAAMGEAWRADLEADGLPGARIERAVHRSHARITGAPTLLLGCLVAEGLNRYEDERRWRAEWGLAQHAFGAALENLLLAASSRGLGAYWISAPLYAPDAVRRTLELDVSWEPQAFVALGRPSAGYAPFDRPSIDVREVLLRR